MTMTIPAVYANGVFTPSVKPDLNEGAAVCLTLSTDPFPPRTPIPEDWSDAMKEWARKLEESTTYKEWMDLANSCPEPDVDEDYDIEQRLRENRMFSGEVVPPEDLR